MLPKQVMETSGGKVDCNIWAVNILIDMNNMTLGSQPNLCFKRRMRFLGLTSDNDST